MASIEQIVEADDPRLADYRHLKDPELRRRAGLFVAEGPTVVRALFASTRLRTRSVLLDETGLRQFAADLDRLGAEVRVFLAPGELVRTIVGFPFHRGCLAVGERPEDPPLGRLLGGRLLILLEELRAPDNVGGVIRNAHAFGADAAVLSPGSADPFSRKALRLSGGTALALPITRVTDWALTLHDVHAAGFSLVALTPAPAAETLEDLVAAPPARMALLLGTEGTGLAAGTLALADRRVRIPMRVGMDSLNVAAASAVALYRIALLPGASR